MSTEGEIMRLAGLLSTARTRRAAVIWGVTGPGINDETLKSTAARCAKAHAELAAFVDSIEYSRTKGWALAKSLQAQVDILLPVVESAATDDEEYGIGHSARGALDKLAEHRGAFADTTKQLMKELNNGTPER